MLPERAHSPPLVTLPQDCAACRAHKEIIADLTESAAKLRLLEGNVRAELFDAGIVCDRGRDDQRASVSSQFFGRALQVIDIENEHRERNPGWAAEVRNLLYEVLAAHLSITERPSDLERTPEELPYEEYRDLIREFEEYCAERGIPSLLPNLFIASSLRKRLRDEDFAEWDENLCGIFPRLATIYRWQEKHIHVIMTVLHGRGKHAEALECVHAAADARGDVHPIGLLWNNARLAEAYVMNLYALGRHQEVIDLCEQLGTGITQGMVVMREKHLQSLTATANAPNVLAFLNEESLPKSPKFREAVVHAGEFIVRWLWSERRHAEVPGFLQRHFANELDEKNGHSILARLYEHNAKILSAQERDRRKRTTQKK